MVSHRLGDFGKIIIKISDDRFDYADGNLYLTKFLVGRMSRPYRPLQTGVEALSRFVPSTIQESEMRSAGIRISKREKVLQGPLIADW